MTDFEMFKKMLEKVQPLDNEEFYENITDTYITLIGADSQTMCFEFDKDGNFEWWE